MIRQAIISIVYAVTSGSLLNSQNARRGLSEAKAGANAARLPAVARTSPSLDVGVLLIAVKAVLPAGTGFVVFTRR